LHLDTSGHCVPRSLQEPGPRSPPRLNLSETFCNTIARQIERVTQVYIGKSWNVEAISRPLANTLHRNLSSRLDYEPAVVKPLHLDISFSGMRRRIQARI
jgi:hypothetical protein